MDEKSEIIPYNNRNAEIQNNSIIESSSTFTPIIYNIQEVTVYFLNYIYAVFRHLKRQEIHIFIKFDYLSFFRFNGLYGVLY